MRRPALTSTALLVFAAALAAQQTPQQPVFRGGVDLVTLDVTVIDKDGKPVRGLKPEDFVVTLEKQPRPVRALDFLEFGSAAGSTADARQTTNQAGQAQPARRGGRAIVILFDDLSYKPGITGKGLLVAAERMIGTFDVDDLIGITTTSGLGPTVNPTRDRAAVLAALHDKKMIGRNDNITAPFYIAVDEAIEIDRDFPRETLDAVAGRECGELGIQVDVCKYMVAAAGRAYAQQITHSTAMQLAAFQTLMGLIKNAPAPKVIIALSAGVAIGTELDLQRQLAPLGRAAAENGVQFYAMSELPDLVDLSERTQARAAARVQEGRFLNSGAQTVAENAGGTAFLVVGQADRFFKRIEAETSGFYRLGVEAPVLTDKHRYLATKVSVKTSGATVRVNREALLAAVAPEAVPIAEQLKTTLAQGGVAFGVPIALGTAQRRDPSSSALQLGVNVQVPSSVPGPLIAMYGLVNEAGEIKQAGRRDVPVPNPGEDYLLAFPVPIESGRYRVRFVIADAKGNIGSVEHGVTAGLAHFGSFSVSDLFTMWAGADRQPRFLALERLPEGAATVGASLELYPDAANPPEVVVRFTLTALGSETALIEREITPELVGATRQAIAELPVDDLQPGAYVIHAAVVEAGTVTGTVTSTIRKGQ
ncbi:MAG TPA: VWA domain-containing protein [Vicinamibacterales bacterium]|nr:VWA domain-containing protein [Vicinamibacterales bacterium]